MIDARMNAAAVLLQRTARRRSRPKETAIVRAPPTTLEAYPVAVERALVPYRKGPSITVLIMGIITLMVGLVLPRVWGGGAMGPMVHLTVKTVHTGTSLPVAAPNGSSVLEIIQRAGAGEADLYTLVGSDGRSLGSHDRITVPATMHLILRPVAPVSLPSNTVATRTEESDRMRTFGELGTLYARCGGIMGIASFADRCMDKWMADPTLNANARVVSWHARSQRCGAATLFLPPSPILLTHPSPHHSAILLTPFSILAAGFKFLVTQLLGYLTGGPQRCAPHHDPRRHRL